MKNAWQLLNALILLHLSKQAHRLNNTVRTFLSEQALTRFLYPPEKWNSCRYWKREFADCRIFISNPKYNGFGGSIEMADWLLMRMIPGARPV